MKKVTQKRLLLGIIGGMGPHADTLFLSELRRLTNAKGDRGHIPVLYDGNCLRPDRSDYLMGKSKYSPRQSLLNSLRTLENAGADVIVLPCNTAHFWYPYLYRKKRKCTVILNMVQEVCRECYAREYKSVCLLATLGTYRKNIYSEYLFRNGVDLVMPSDMQKERIRELILEIKRGKRIPITELEDELSDIKCDAFILGCTELSRAFSFAPERGKKYVDALDCLVKRTHLMFDKK
jgi:aspartate racemase